MFLLCHDPAVAPPADIVEQHFAFARLVRERKAYVASDALAPIETAVTVRKRGNKQKPLITDGPYAESKEVVGGFYILNCRDREEALEFAAKLPSETVEVRPLWQVPGWEYTLPGERWNPPSS
jgi:hypothetical protein